MKKIFALGRRSLARQVLVVALSVAMLITGLTVAAVAWFTTTAAVANVGNQMGESLQSVYKSLEFAYNAANTRAEQQMFTYLRILGELPSMGTNTVETGKAGMVPALTAAGVVLNANTQLLTNVRDVTGAEAEVLVRHNGAWVRASTLRLDAQGMSMLGGPIDPKSPITKLLDAGDQATAIVNEGGGWAAVRVWPIKDSSDKVVAGLALYVDQTIEVSDMLEYLRTASVLKVGKLHVVGPGGDGRPMFLVDSTDERKMIDEVFKGPDLAAVQGMIATDSGFAEQKFERDTATALRAWRKSPQWGWTVIVDGEKDAFLAQEYRNVLILVGLLVGGGILTALLISWRTARTLAPVKQVVQGISRLGEGNLTEDVPRGPKGSKSEIHIMAEQINLTRERIAQLAQQMNVTGNQVASASTQTLASLHQIGQGTVVQSEAASGVAAAVEELSVSISQIADNTIEANGFSKQSSDAAAEGAAVVTATVDDIERVATLVTETAEAVGQLEASSRQISAVVKTIQEIADQTNLLALNAAIEAARAGEEGRGFSVVADEVRNLAERTKQSTAQIAGVIAESQRQTALAAEAMRVVNTDMQRSAQGARDAGLVLGRIREATARTASVIADISNAAGEQKSASEQIALRVEQIAQYTEQSATAVQQSVTVAESLQDQARALDTAIRTLRT